mmetsp:Transcript_2751/g.5600  ORF Transcript_2751/g.5600 Transcript_2751/m.5600 type:complete len:90 (-) Transcript_2751:397-666(-)
MAKGPGHSPPLVKGTFVVHALPVSAMLELITRRAAAGNPCIVSFRSLQITVRFSEIIFMTQVNLKIPLDCCVKGSWNVSFKKAGPQAML